MKKAPSKAGAKRSHGIPERRWLVITEDGRHVTLGRHSDPTEAEIAATGQGCDQIGLAAWLVISEGTYYSRNGIRLMCVRRITTKDGDWGTAERCWHSNREQALQDTGG